MPYKEVNVEPDRLTVIEINGLYIEVFHTYKDGNFKERFNDFYSFFKDDDAGDFDIKVLGKEYSIEFPNPTTDVAKFNQIVIEFIRRTIMDGKLDHELADYTQEHIASARAGKYKPEIEPDACPKCGNHHFIAHQKCYHDIIVDSNNNFQDNIEIYASADPYGPYTCSLCGTEYPNLPNRRGIDG